jgi:hypothetical protein
LQLDKLVALVEERLPVSFEDEDEDEEDYMDEDEEEEGERAAACVTYCSYMLCIRKGGGRMAAEHMTCLLGWLDVCLF